MPDNELQPVLLDVRAAAKFCSCGVTLWRQLMLTGRTPEPSYLNSKIVFSRRLLEIWSISGCPARDTEKWQRILEMERNA